MLHYTSENAVAKTPPVEICGTPKYWAARLYVGPLAAAISSQWLEWCGITHILCVLGRFDDNQCETKEWKAAHAHRQAGISYLDWPIGNTSERSLGRAVFSSLSKVLSRPNNAVLVHCRNGKDRSCMAVFAFLRLQMSFTHGDALQALRVRVGCNGKPLFNLNDQHQAVLNWYHDSLDESCEEAPFEAVWTKHA